MASENSTQHRGATDSRSAWPGVSTRMRPEDIQRLELARVYGKFPDRSSLIYEAVMERVERILAAHSVGTYSHRRAGDLDPDPAA